MLPAVLAGAAGAGCGGDDATVTTGPLVPSKPDYISQADGLCAFYQDRIERTGRDQLGLRANDFRVLPSGRVVFRPGRRPSDARIEAFVDQVAVPNLRQQLDELRALTPPTGEEARVATTFDAAGRAIESLAADPAVATDSGRTARLFDPALRSARAYGFKVCGYPPSAVPEEASR
jgi:hypothetical protein